MKRFMKIVVLLAVLFIQLTAASKEGEFNYNCFGNDKNHKGKNICSQIGYIVLKLIIVLIEFSLTKSIKSIKKTH